MFFFIHELDLRKIPFDVVYPPGEIEFLDNALEQTGDLKAAGTVELCNQSLGEIRARGQLRVPMKTTCDRCLEAAEIVIDTPFDLYYRPSDAEPEADEVQLDPAELEIAFYEGHGLSLEEILREQILLSMPMQYLCSEACKGICPVCGQNRNQSNCNCAIPAADDRWSVLQGW